MVDQEIRVLGDENIIANPKNSQKQYPLTFKAVPNVIVYGRKKDNLNFTVPIPEGVNFNFNLDRTSIIFADNFNLEEYSYIMVKNPFEEIQDFFYVSSLEELDPTGKEFNEFNDEVVKWLRRLVNIISNRCMIFETTLFKDLNNFPNIKSGQTFIRTDDGWTGITIRDINSELDIIFNKYVEEINKKIQEHQAQINELLEQWKQDIQKYAENVKQYEIVRIVTQSGHGFVFEPVMYSISQRKFVKALFPHGADGIAVRVDDNTFKLLWAGRVEIPEATRDNNGNELIIGEYYFLGEGSNGGIQREKPDTYYQHLFQVQNSDILGQKIADVLLSVPINQRGKAYNIDDENSSKRPKLMSRNKNEISIGKTTFSMNGFRFMGQLENNLKKKYTTSPSNKLGRFVSYCNLDRSLAWTNIKPLESWIGVFATPKNLTENEFKIVPFMQVKSATGKIITLSKTKVKSWANSEWDIPINKNILNKKVLIITKNGDFLGDIDEVVDYNLDTITLRNNTLNTGDYFIVAPTDEFCYLGSCYINKTQLESIGDNGFDVVIKSDNLAYSGDFSLGKNINSENCISPLATAIFLKSSVNTNVNKTGNFEVFGGIDADNLVSLSKSNKYSNGAIIIETPILKINLDHSANFGIKILDELSTSANDVTVSVYGYTEM